ncbi:MAG: hypothetical protein IKU94_07915 [Bacteroidaceae bacterium]|nr:hypothetical protein [Bacteroidaceae bacterium]
MLGAGVEPASRAFKVNIPYYDLKLCLLSYPGIMPVSPGCPSVYSDCRVVRRHTLRRSLFLQGF